MAHDYKYVRGFGGGLRFDSHPVELPDDAWTWADGFVAKDGYAEVVRGVNTTNATATPIPDAGYVATGVVQSPFTENQLLIAAAHDTNRLVKVYPATANSAGPYTALTDGGFPPSGRATGKPTAAMFENALFMCFGMQDAGPLLAEYNLARISPTAAGLTPTALERIDKITNAAVSSSFLAGAIARVRDFLIAAPINRRGTSATVREAFRSVAWCDMKNPLQWDERIWNAAGRQEWEELAHKINGLVALDANSALLSTPTVMIEARYTGGNPPFTRHQVHDLTGNVAGTPKIVATGPAEVVGGLAKTPFGVTYYGDDDVYVWSQGGAQGIAGPVRRYFRERFSSWPANIPMPSMVWHAALGVLMVPIRNGGNMEWFMFDPRSGAWSRRFDNNAAISVRDSIYVQQADANGMLDGRWMILNGNGVLTQEHSTTTTPFGGPSGAVAFVDTKDFHLIDSTSNRRIDMIAVDWEPLSNASTDAIEVLAATRDPIGGGILGAASGEQDLSSIFVSLGTLTGGSNHELSIPAGLRKRFVRFRFRATSGRCRIRGFVFRLVAGSDIAS